MFYSSCFYALFGFAHQNGFDDDAKLAILKGLESSSDPGTWSTLTHCMNPGTKLNKVLPQEVVLRANQMLPKQTNP